MNQSRDTYRPLRFPLHLQSVAMLSVKLIEKAHLLFPPWVGMQCPICYCLPWSSGLLQCCLSFCLADSQAALAKLSHQALSPSSGGNIPDCLLLWFHRLPRRGHSICSLCFRASFQRPLVPFHWIKISRCKRLKISIKGDFKKPSDF